MADKLKGVIQEATFDKATFEDKPVTIEFAPINFLYGQNGTGKSTIASTLSDSTTSTFSPSYTPESFDVLFFNQDYIVNNMTAVRDERGLGAVFMLDSVNQEINEQINKKRKEIEKVANKAAAQTATLTDRQGEISKEIEKVKSKFLATTQKVRENYKNKLLSAGEATRFDKILELIDNFDNTPYLDSPVTLVSLEKYYIDFIANVSSDLPVLKLEVHDFFEDLSIFAETLINSTASQFKEFIDKLGAENWFRESYDKFSKSDTDGLCPYCQQPLPDDFNEQVAHAFDETYSNKIKELQKVIRLVKNHLENIRENLQELMNQTWSDEKYLSDFIRVCGNFTQILNKNFELLDEKNKTPSLKIELVSWTGCLDDIHDLILKNNKKANEINALKADPAAAKQKGLSMLISYMKCLTSGEIAEYKTKVEEKNTIGKSIEKISTDAESEKKTLELEVEELKLKLTDTGTIVDSINKLLKNSGFTGFHLEEIDHETHKVQVIRDRTKLPAKRLSEGEKNFLMFLYFYFSVKGSSDPTGEIKNKIVIIDDPVTSMDSNALLIISTLIRELIGICENNYKLEDGITKVDYIKQIFLLSHNPYFFRATTDEWIDEYTYVSYYYVHKEGNQSGINLMKAINPSNPTEYTNAFPVKNAYNALWDQFNNTACDSVSLMNAARQILEHYFIQICKTKSTKIRKELLEVHKDAFITVDEFGNEDTSNYNMVSSLLSCLTSTLDDDFAFDVSAFSTDSIRLNFKQIFKIMRQEDHYNAMAK